MKTTRTFLLLIFTYALLLSTSVSAQKKVEKFYSSVTVDDFSGVEYTFSGEGVEVKNGNRNYLATVHIKVSAEELADFDFGGYPNFLFGGTLEIELDKDYMLYDSTIYLTKSGNITATFQKNGSGKYWVIDDED